MAIFVNHEYDENMLSDELKRDLSSIGLRELCEFALFAEGIDCNAQVNVSITLVDNEQMQALNSKFRGIDAPTDVLSFEMDDAWENNNSQVRELGDIFIAPKVAREQCEKFNMTFEGEMSLLLVHGILHLCGYDHIEDADAKIMQAREIEILRAWQVGHPNVCPPNYEINAHMVTGAH